MDRLAGTLTIDDSKAGGPKVSVTFDAKIDLSLSLADEEEEGGEEERGDGGGAGTGTSGGQGGALASENR